MVNFKMKHLLKLNMLLQGCILLLCLCYVNTSDDLDRRLGMNRVYMDRFSWWPSIHNSASLIRTRREISSPVNTETVASEGGVLNEPVITSNVVKKPAAPITTPVPDIELKQNISVTPVQPVSTTQSHVSEHSKMLENNKEEISNSTPKGNNTTNTTLAPVEKITNVSKANVTASAKDVGINSPGVIKRGVIVFGGFALMAVAYFIFYRKKRKNSDISNTHGTIDPNQFRYGVLQSEDQRDSMESSRIPLTMESDDDDEEDMEIFDLEQKKKSLSYVNLQMNDEDVVLGGTDTKGNDADSLLLDIEDGNSETLINWSSTGSKSIL